MTSWLTSVTMISLPTEIIELITLFAKDKGVSAVLKPYISTRIYKESFTKSLCLQYGEYRLVIKMPKPIKRESSIFVFSRKTYSFVDIAKQQITYCMGHFHQSMMVQIPTIYRANDFLMDTCLDLLTCPKIYSYNLFQKKPIIRLYDSRFFICVSGKLSEKTVKVSCHFDITQKEWRELQTETFDITMQYLRIVKNKEHVKIQVCVENSSITFYMPSKQFVLSRI